MVEINIASTNEMKDNTCGSCIHTDNNLGIFALHCDILREKQIKNKEDCPDGKVRSWYKCEFKPSRYEKRKVREK